MTRWDVIATIPGLLVAVLYARIWFHNARIDRIEKERTMRCKWETCQETATQIAKWRNEDNPPKPDTFVGYCDVHVHEATKHGAVATGASMPSCDCGGEATGPFSVQHRRGCIIPGPHNDPLVKR